MVSNYKQSSSYKCVICYDSINLQENNLNISAENHILNHILFVDYMFLAGSVDILKHLFWFTFESDTKKYPHIIYLDEGIFSISLTFC